MTLDPNFPKLVLDPGNEQELIQLTYNRIKTASGNTITDFRAGSAVAALVEGQTFALAELLYYLNLMPEAIAIEVFRLYGIQRSLGTKASGAVTFLLTEPAVDVFSLPVGYLIPYLDGNLVLQSALVIPQGAQEGTVSILLDRVGSIYNAEAFDILATNTGLARVQSIYNRLPLTGGSDIEALDVLIQRCQAATVSRSSVITQLDYELSVQAFLGLGSRAIVVPNLAPDTINFLQNAVCAFSLDATGVPTNLVTNASIKADLDKKILLGTSVTCLPIALTPLTVELTVNVRSVDAVLGAKIAAKVVNYLNPKTYNNDRLLVRNDEIGYQVRAVDKVLSIDFVTIDAVDGDKALPNRWTLPYASVVSVTMVSPEGQTLLYTGGIGNGDVYDEDEELV